MQFRLLESKFLTEQEEVRREASTRIHELFPQYRGRPVISEYAEAEIEAPMQLEQVSVCERMKELGQKYAQKIVQEGQRGDLILSPG